MNKMKNKTKMNIFVAMYEATYIMIVRFPIPLKLWLLTMFIMNLAGYVVLFPESLETKIIAIVCCVGAMLISYIYSITGFTRLLGLGHTLWIPLVIWLSIYRIPTLLRTTGEQEQDDQQQDLKNWLIGVVVIDSISLILDIKDVLQYINGDREPLLYYHSEQQDKKQAAAAATKTTTTTKKKSS